MMASVYTHSPDTASEISKKRSTGSVELDARHHAKDQNLGISELHEDRGFGAGDQKDGGIRLQQQGAFRIEEDAAFNMQISFNSRLGIGIRIGRMWFLT